MCKIFKQNIFLFDDLVRGLKWFILCLELKQAPQQTVEPWMLTGIWVQNPALSSIGFKMVWRILEAMVQEFEDTDSWTYISTVEFAGFCHYFWADFVISWLWDYRDYLWISNFGLLFEIVWTRRQCLVSLVGRGETAGPSCGNRLKVFSLSKISGLEYQGEQTEIDILAHVYVI